MAKKSTIENQLTSIQTIRTINILWIWVTVFTISLFVGLFHLKSSISKATFWDRLMLSSIALSGLYAGNQLYCKDKADEKKEHKLIKMLNQK